MYYRPLHPRVIPVLLLKGSGLVKTRGFRDPVYLGDPRNVVKIFNEKEVDELVLLDITASLEGREPPYALIEEIASECFAPFGYGGGITRPEQVRRLVNIGLEKVVLNSHALANPKLVEESARIVGSSSTVICIDVRQKPRGGYEVFTHAGRRGTGRDPVEVARAMEQAGAGEIIVQSIDRDGAMQGYDLNLLQSVSSAVSIPLIACGGAGGVPDLVTAVQAGGASAAAAGSIFVFYGRLRGVLIQFPDGKELDQAFGITAGQANA